MVDEVRKSDLAREERMREQAAEKARPKQQESEFDRLVKGGQMQQQATTAKLQQKPVTEQAMDEAAKREQREQELRKKEHDERKEKKEGAKQEQRQSSGITEQRVVAKGGHGEGGGRGGGEGRGGFDSSAGRRGLSKKLSDVGVKTLPADLQKKFAAKLMQAQAARSQGQAQLTQQLLNKIVQYVRMGINRAGEKEIQIDLHEKIFRGLKLRVTASGGKVCVHLRTRDARGREALERNSDQLRRALADKGIDVSEITIA
ncbi:MAG: flagellar hook-length control protein FliK [Proteobacteria bacterium]|nr:flagellar hook-length control protein FliK [Pseudomonadota bacterium]